MSEASGQIFARLATFEEKSLAHDAGESDRQEQISNWDGVVFRLADYRLTCAIDQIDEVLAFPSYTQVPGAKEWILGLSNVRGNLVPVIDLGWYLFGSRTPVSMRTRLLLARIQGRATGLMVDEVFGQRHFHTDDARECESTRDTPLEAYVRKEFPLGEDTWGILHLETLMRKPDFVDGAA